MLSLSWLSLYVYSLSLESKTACIAVAVFIICCCWVLIIGARIAGAVMFVAIVGVHDVS